MKIAIVGSIAFDHLMTYPGKFADSLVAEKLDQISLSFLVDGLHVRKGGVGPNIAFGMGVLGARPLLAGAAGEDFGEGKAFLERHNIDTSWVRMSTEKHTARFTCMSDEDGNQIASFYPGAMEQSKEIDIGVVNADVGPIDIVLIGADDPEAMLLHTRQCREYGLAFIADPSQQLPRLECDEILALIDGAKFLFTNEYEYSLILKKTGLNKADVLQMVDVHVQTLGERGSVICTRESDVVVPCVAGLDVKDPTGVGDAYRAGFLVAWATGLDWVHCAALGSGLAAFVIETIGTQEYVFSWDRCEQLLSDTYGKDEARVVCSAVQEIV